MITLIAVAILFSAAPSYAQQSYKGSFTLPFEVNWGGLVLPPGSYTFTIPDIAVTPHLLQVQGQGPSAFIYATTADSKVASGGSQLTLRNVGGELVVRTLEAREIGLTFFFATPKAPNDCLAKTRKAPRAEPSIEDVAEPIAGGS